MVCGHIHHATIRDDFGIRYVNCGDWVESCTAVVEHRDGQLEIVHWSDEMRKRGPIAAPPLGVAGQGSEIAA